MYSYRQARAMHTPTPIDWSTFCRKAHEDANAEYTEQLIAEATPDDLRQMVRDLQQRLRGATFAAQINHDTIVAMRKRHRA